MTSVVDTRLTFKWAVKGLSERADIATERIVTGPMRMMIVPFVVLAGASALDLYLLPQHTDRFFAWTLRPQASAMFMGAGYAAGVVMTVPSFRRQPWVVTRIATYSIFVFVVTMSAATLLHLDRMHFHSGPTSARAAAWLWIVVYVVVPVALAVVHEEREPGGDPPRCAPLALWLRTVLGTQGAVMVGFGIALFAWPTHMDRVWPWPITALSGRALASWLLAIGCAGLDAVFENDLHRLRPALITYTVLGLLWLVALLRAADDVRWARAGAWVYAFAVLSVSAAGGIGWRLAARAGR